MTQAANQSRRKGHYRGPGAGAWTAEERAANSRKAKSFRLMNINPVWDWAAEMPRLRANVRAAVLAEIGEKAAE